MVQVSVNSQAAIKQKDVTSRIIRSAFMGQSATINLLAQGIH